MNYAIVIIALLKLVGSLAGWFQQQKWINEGESIAVAKAAAEVARKSGYARKALDDMHGKSDSELDDLLRELEPDEPDRK